MKRVALHVWQCSKFIDQGEREDRGAFTALIGQGGGSRPVGGDFERSYAGELLGPIGELGMNRLSLKPLVLPEGVVSILNRELGKR